MSSNIFSFLQFYFENFVFFRNCCPTITNFDETIPEFHRVFRKRSKSPRLFSSSTHELIRTSIGHYDVSDMRHGLVQWLERISQLVIRRGRACVNVIWDRRSLFSELGRRTNRRQQWMSIHWIEYTHVTIIVDLQYLHPSPPYPKDSLWAQVRRLLCMFKCSELDCKEN